MSTPLEIVVTGNTSGAKTALKDVQAELGKTAIAAQKTSSELEDVGKSVNATASVNKLGDALKKTVPSSNSAAFALQNLGRVAQDAPFGFIGIANNINPLLESFQRLQKESGGTKNALKALIGGLAGAGGLGLAVSLGTAALSLFGMAMQRSGKETKEAKETVDEYGKVIQGITSKVGEQLSSINVLVQAYQKENISQSERVAIIEKLKQISPEYFNQLKSEKTSIDDLTIAYNAYAESINKSIVAEIKRDKLKKLLEKQLTLSVDLNLIESDTRLNSLFNKIPQAANSAAKKTADIFRKNPFVTPEISKQQDLYLKDYDTRLQGYNKLGKEASAIELELSKLEVFKQVDADKKQKSIETIADVLKKLREGIVVLNKEEITFGTNEAQNKIKLLEGAISDLFKKFKLGTENNIVVGLKFEADDIRERERIRKIGPELIGKDFSIPVPLTVTPPKLDEFVRIFKPIETEIDKLNQQIADNLKNNLTSALAGIGEDIGSAIAGGGDLGETIFGGLFRVLAEGIKQLGESMIVLGTAKIAIEKFKFAPGIGTVVAGIATVALGSLLEAAIPKFAGGVTNFGGGLAMVGERGPELVSLPRGSDVIPNNQLRGSGGGVFIPSVVIRGADLLLSFNRASAQAKRNN